MADINSPSPPDETEPAKAGNSKTAIGCIQIFLFILILILWAFMPDSSISTERSKMIQEVSIIKNLVMGCRLYADDWEGKLPEKLRDLYPEYLDDEKLFQTTEYKKKEFKYYIYYPRKAVDTDSQEILLIASPFVRKGERVVGFTGGNVTALKEDEYQKLIKPSGNSN